MTTYRPINCSFYDILEANATLKKTIRVVFLTTDGQQTETQGRIVNLFTKNKEEFVALSDGNLIRLDQLISVDGQQLEGFCEI